jgi:hypothetical protein
MNPVDNGLIQIVEEEKEEDPGNFSDPDSEKSDF